MFPIIIYSLFLQITSVLQSALSKTDTFATGTKCSSLERCPSYRESTECKERQGPNISVHKGVHYERVACKLINCIARQHVVMVMIHQAWSQQHALHAS